MHCALLRSLFRPIIAGGRKKLVHSYYLLFAPSRSCLALSEIVSFHGLKSAILDGGGLSVRVNPPSAGVGRGM